VGGARLVVGGDNKCHLKSSGNPFPKTQIF
jgi:hypothetical protein